MFRQRTHPAFLLLMNGHCRLWINDSAPNLPDPRQIGPLCRLTNIRQMDQVPGVPERPKARLCYIRSGLLFLRMANDSGCNFAVD